MKLFRLYLYTGKYQDIIAETYGDAESKSDYTSDEILRIEFIGRIKE